MTVTGEIRKRYFYPIMYERKYTGHSQNMIMTTLSTHEVPKVQEEIQKIDETAFIVIIPASTVMGRGFSLQKDYQRVPNDFINPL